MSLINKIEIKNFKSIRHQTIDDCRRINVFIGYPNVGKSNILEALGLFSMNQNSSNLNDFVRIEELTTFFFDGYIDKNVEVTINSVNRIIGKYSNGSLKITNGYDREKYGFDNIDLSQFSIDKLPVIDFCSFSVEDSGKIVEFNGSNGIKLDTENPLIEVNKYEYKKQLKYVFGSGWKLFRPFGENIFSVISENRIIKHEVEKIFLPDNLELLFDTRQQIFTILKRTDSGIFTIPYELIADTLQRLIFYKTAILSNNKSLLLFEEPEAHMFPPYISKLTSDIINDPRENQYFITTHSPFVMNDLISNAEKDELSIYIVSYENETGQTLINRMTEEDVDEAYQFGYDFFMNINNFIPQKQHD
ncbi:MAG: AAA family ATPase [Chitinophagaceae bacterium]|nr:AAA family ATPase [Chitinophagaceae bacterium]